MKSVLSFLVLAGLLMLGAQFAEPQSVGGVPSRLRIRSLGVNVAAPATAGDVAIGGACTVASSRCNTIATNGRAAYGFVNGATGALSNSLNVTSASRGGVGTYTINITAAGFTVVPVCVVAMGGNLGSATSTTVTATSLGVTTGDFVPAAADRNFTFACHGI